jgi:4-hydroxy-3-polyprenylbenzoate decarboxylase
MKGKHLVLAMTGASGSIYGVRLCRALLDAGCRVTLLLTSTGAAVLKEECGLDWRGDEASVTAAVQAYYGETERLAHYGGDNFFAAIASGSSAADAMVVCPCSMGSLGRIAAGFSSSLLERVADVMLKEGRTLVLVPRETPLSAIHLENMLKLARLGVRIVPPMPAFYHHPKTLDDLVDFVVGKVLDQLGVEHRLYKRWGAP